MEKFFVGMHRIGSAWKFDRAFISANRLWDYYGLVGADEWVMDSGAFTEITKYGRYRYDVEAYAEVIKRFSTEKGLLAAVAQDYMCEPFVLNITGLTIDDHQRLTLERYDALMQCDVGGVTIIPVLQGFDPEDYVRHVRMYGDRLKPGMWVGVGSVCKRQGSPRDIVKVLSAIKAERPDLRLHGFGVKLTSLRDKEVCDLLYTADSMAWSFAARKRCGDANSLWVARDWEAKVLEAIGQAPGINLAGYLKLNCQMNADEDNRRASVRRVDNAEWAQAWKRIQAMGAGAPA